MFRPDEISHPGNAARIMPNRFGRYASPSPHAPGNTGVMQMHLTALSTLLTACLTLLLAGVFAGCSDQPTAGSRQSPAHSSSPQATPQSTTGKLPQQSPANPDRSASVPAPTAEPGLHTFDVVRIYPHDTSAFTQGLLYLDGFLYESTGLHGESSVRKVELETGKVLKRISVPSQYFAEGMTLFGTNLFQLTWQSQKGFVYDLENFKVLREFSYEGEGWGLTSDGQQLILSDGTENLRFLDPATFKTNKTVRVTHRNRPVNRLNELEFIKGEIWANVWRTDFVVRIHPESGKITGVIDFTGLLPAQDRGLTTDVLNGIAHDAKGDRLFITGKLWPKIFEVRLRPK